MNDSGNPYLNSDGSPSLRESVVVFLDLLGYGALLENSYATNSQKPVLQQLHTAMRDAYAPIRGFPLHGDQRSWEARTFTDNTIIGFPLFLDRDAEAELALITGRVARFQFELSKHGFLVRGAIAIGEFFMDANAVFGNALLEAYRAERSTTPNNDQRKAARVSRGSANLVKDCVGGSLPQLFLPTTPRSTARRLHR